MTVGKVGDKSAANKMTHTEFTLKAIRLCKEQTGYDGMHTVWSGFSRAFRAYFGCTKEGTIEAIDKLVKDGVIGLIPWKGGPKLYIPEDMPKASDGPNKKSEELLAAITG